MITLTKVPQEPEKVCSGCADGHPDKEEQK